MFLEYFVWGSWYVTISTWLSSSLHFTGEQVGIVGGATGVGAIVAPFFAWPGCRQICGDREDPRLLTPYRCAVAFSRIAPDRFSRALHHHAFVLSLLHADDSADQLAFVPPDGGPEAGVWADSRAGHRGLDRCRALHWFARPGGNAPPRRNRGRLFGPYGPLLLYAASHSAVGPGGEIFRRQALS